MIGDPGLLEEMPGIAALLPEAGCANEQAATADRTLAGLDAVTDLAMKHRLAQGTYSYEAAEKGCGRLTIMGEPFKSMQFFSPE